MNASQMGHDKMNVSLSILFLAQLKHNVPLRALVFTTLSQKAMKQRFVHFLLRRKEEEEKNWKINYPYWRNSRPPHTSFAHYLICHVLCLVWFTTTLWMSINVPLSSTPSQTSGMHMNIWKPKWWNWSHTDCLSNTIFFIARDSRILKL